MWNCGSARFCLCVVAGTGLSMSVCPDSWMLLAVLSAVAAIGSGLRHKAGSGAAADLLIAVALVSAVGFAACTRLSAECSRVQVKHESVVTLRGTVCGFVQPSRTGGSVVARTAGCRVLVRFRNLPDDVRPGDVLTVTGSLRSTFGPRNPGCFSEASYLFQQDIWYVLDAPGYLRPSVDRHGRPNGIAGAYVAPVREWIKKSLNGRMAGQEKAFLLALVLGERGEFSEETKAAFRDSGLVHILSVSGLHTALVGLAGFIVLKGAGVRGRAAMAGATGLVWFYCALSGFQPPTVRSALMLSWMTASRAAGRSTELMAPLFASCAALLLLCPRYFWDPGFELSYLATGSVIMSARLARRIKASLKLPERAWKYFGSTVLTTCVAQLGVLPLLALQFGSVSLASVPANLLGIPLASAGLVCGFCALAAAAVCPWVAGIVFELAWLLLRLCNLVAEVASSAPHAVLELSRPHTIEVVLFLTCFFAALELAGQAGAAVSRGRRLCLVLCASCTVVLMVRLTLPVAVPLCLPAGRSGGVTVDFLDVGQGDAAAFLLPGGKTVLVDAGDAKEEWDCGQRVLGPYLRTKGLRSVDVAIISHLHSDHAGGLVWLLEKGKVRRVVASGADTTSSYWRLVRRGAKKSGATVEASGVGETSLRFSGRAGNPGDGPVVRFLAPSGGALPDTLSPSVNDSSTVCLLEYGRTRVVMTGDAGAAVLDRLADELAGFAGVTIVKAPHHGATATLCPRFAEAVRPDFVVFSVGRQNRFGHPDKRVVESYERVGARVFRTDADGCVSFEIPPAGVPRPSAADPAASHAFIRKAKRWRADEALRGLTLLSFADRHMRAH